MRRIKLSIVALGVAASHATLSPAAAQGVDRTGSGFTVRDGYEVATAIEDLPRARYLEFDDRDTLYVARPGAGDITTWRDDNGDGEYERLATFVSGRRSVSSLCFARGWMWFGTSGAVHKAKDDDGDGEADRVETVIDDLPSGGQHWWRSLLITEDAIYTSIGDGGNIDDETDTDRQKIWMYDLEGGNKRLFASGIRNTEKLRLRPGTDEVWGFDHGSDNFGAELGERMGRLQPVTDHSPPDELNHYTQGGFYGHPFITGDMIPRYEYTDRDDILELADKTIPPAWEITAHAATNGFTFIGPAENAGEHALPAEHEGDVFVACHGSWNRTDRSGYSIVRVLFDGGRPYGSLTVVKLLGQGEEVLGRPVDCVQAPDGSVLFSDDHSGAVYSIRWAGQSE